MAGGNAPAIFYLAASRQFFPALQLLPHARQ
jgi:hypothetical protein